MGWTSPEAREMFRWFVDHEAERRARALASTSDALQTLPTSQETLNALGKLSPEDAERALRAHPGYPMQRKIESLSTMLKLFHRALADLATSVEEFPDAGPAGGDDSREELEDLVSTRVNKDLFAALGAAKTLVDYSRRLKGLLEDNVFDVKVNAAFPAGEHSLVMGLRNIVLHQVHSQANWQRRWTSESRTTHFIIRREVLLAEGDFNSAAREYLDQLGPNCDVTDLLKRYANKVNDFYGWFLRAINAHLPLEVVDYRTCLRAIEVDHGRRSYEVWIGLWEQAGADPYAHLHKHLTPQQLEVMEAMPHRSPVQVDYVIQCLDKKSVCDDQLRNIVYRFFKVETPIVS